MISRLAIDLSLHQRSNYGSAVLRVYPLPGPFDASQTLRKKPHACAKSQLKLRKARAHFSRWEVLCFFSPSFVLRPPIQHEHAPPIIYVSRCRTVQYRCIGSQKVFLRYAAQSRYSRVSQYDPPSQVSKPKLSGRGEFGAFKRTVWR